MRSAILSSLLGGAWLALATVPAHADVLTVNSILTAQKAGAPIDGIIAMVNDPGNAVGMSAGDLVTLRDAGVSEHVIAAVWARVPAPTPTSVPIEPDDGRLVDLVPTLCYLLDLPVPEQAEGAVLYQAFQNPNSKQARRERLSIAP